jgi:hypothetical protein
VAVKVLKTGLTHDPRWEKRFQRELRLGRPIQHPNVCRIFDIGDSEGYRFLTMEYAKSGTLRDLIKKNQPLRSLEERLADAGWAIAGLAAIHEAGIVHRDVKPDNMLRMEDGRLVLSDFGLATDLPDSTMVSVFVGTPHYMAPEVREGDPATTRSDVWSLGVVLHEIFFGKRPERRASRTASGIARSSTVATSSTIERAMMALCLRCLSDDPADRPENANAVRRLFDQAHRAPSAMLRSPRRRLAATAAVAIAAVVTSVGLAIRSYRRAHTMPAAAGIPHVTPTGEPAEWSRAARTIAVVPGHVHCFSLVNRDTVRMIWGAPRKAEDIDLATGGRRSAPLASETFSSGCPDLSPDGHELLFTAHSAAGGTEIRHSSNPDGRDAHPVTVGSDPLWLSGGDEFVYNIDSTHTAHFSLATMKFRLLGDAGLAGQQTILGKAVSRRADTVALMLFGNDVQWAVAVYSGPSLSTRKIFSIPAARGIRFVGEEIFVSLQEARAPLASLDWQNGAYRNVGRYGESDLIDVLPSGDEAALVARRRTRDVWLYGSSGKKRLTSDGQNVDAAISDAGELLVARTGPGPGVNIWSIGVNGALRRLTSGQFDASPEFSPDGKTWVYVDYREKSIMLCGTATGTCRVFKRDEMLPAWPRFSPDGSKLAYVTQSSGPRLKVVQISSGDEWQVGETYWQCPPVWSSDTNVWGFEGSPGHYLWAERDVEKRVRTGHRIEIKGDQNPENDDLECWPRDVDERSPFFRKLRMETEETSSLLRLPVRSLMDRPR